MSVTDTDLGRLLVDYLASRRRNGEAKSEVLTDPWSQNPFVRAGVSALYRFVKGVCAEAVTGNRDEAEAADEIGSDHPLALVLASPSPGVYGAELWAQCVAYKKLDGHAFVLLYGNGPNGWWYRDGKEWPREMHTVNTRAVRADESDIDPITGAVRQWRVRTRRGPELVVPSDAVLHLRDFDPRDVIGCTSPLAPVWLGMEADLNIDAYARSWLANVGAIGTWLQSKTTMSAEEQKAVLSAFNDAFGGADNAGKTFLSGPDLDIKQGTAQTAKDMEMPRLREWNRDVVKAVLAVTDYEVGRVADYNRANAESARHWLLTNTILPELDSFEQAFWSHVAEPMSRHEKADVWMRFDRDGIEALKPQLAETATTAQTLIATGFDPAQVADKLGLGLDFLETPIAVRETIAAPAGTPAAADALATPTDKAPVAAKSITTKRGKPNRLPPMVAARLHRQWQSHAEKTLGVRWRKFTGERYAETVKAAREAADLGPLKPSIAEKIVGRQDVWAAGAKKAGEPLKNMGKPLAENLGLEVGGFRRVDIGQQTFEAEAAKRIAQMVKVGEGLRVRMRDMIAKTLTDEELDIGGMEKLLATRFKAVLPSNAATVARTEAGIFANDVRNNLMKAEGIEEKEWLSANDEFTRDTHRALDGVKIGIHERFANGLLYPMESGAPAGEVVNCRCMTLASVKEEG